MKASVVTKYEVILILKPKQGLLHKNNVRGMDSIHHVWADSPFLNFITKLSAQARRFPKNNVVTIAAQYLIALIRLSGAGSQKLCEMI